MMVSATESAFLCLFVGFLVGGGVGYCCFVFVVLKAARAGIIALVVFTISTNLLLF